MGKSFWEDTDYRIKEVTTILETNLKASIGPVSGLIPVGAEGAERLTEEQKREVAQRAQNVVNSVQIRELSDIIDLLDGVLADDEQKRYFIVIDRLDENWIEDRLRYPLIRALIETVRDFMRVRQVKIVVAFRYDLIDRVFRVTRDAGFQEEKYESLYLDVSWTKDQLVELLDRRIGALVRPRYTKRGVTHKQLLPAHVGNESGIDYFLERTMMRPRDVILFFNTCIAKAVDRPEITKDMLREAEGEYSRDRFRSLQEEWMGDYPALTDFARVLRNRSSTFRLADVPDNDLADIAVPVVAREGAAQGTRCELVECARSFVGGSVGANDFRKKLVQVFYRTGLVGLKLEAFERVAWVSSGRRSISWAEISPDTRIAIHPCFWRTLGIRPM